MKTSPGHVVLCSTCGRTLNAKGECLACLVRVGFDQPPSEFTSRVFGDFEIARREDGSFWELGRGAMGVTYRAEDKVLKRSVALKVIDAPEAAGDGQMVRDRFLREARAAAAFRHPNVAGVFHFGVSPDGDGCYYAMELVEGETLEELVRRDGPLKVEAALEIAVQVTRALIAAAAHGLIHRDLKPGNIMLTHRDGTAAELEVKVIDFGLAKAIADGGVERDLTQGGFVGTPAFASPEQFRGAPADARSDIYSLGATLWYALTGEVPYEGKSIGEIRHGQSDLPLPVERLVARKIPTPVIHLLRRILAVDPARRPASARELMEMVESCRVRLGFIPLPGSKVWRTGQKVAAAFVGLAVVGAVTFFTVRLQQQTVVTPPPIPEKSIAVLPIVNSTGDLANEYFSDGMSEEFISSLSRLRDLKVVGRSSSFQFKGKTDDSKTIGEKLGVYYLLEGTVQKSANRVRIAVALVKAGDGVNVWAETYDRELKDIFAVQSEIAGAVAKELKVALLGNNGQAAQLTTAATPSNQNIEAYNALLQGNFYNNRRTAEDYRKAIGSYEEAIRLDPRYALAYAKLSLAALNATASGGLPPEERKALIAKGRDYAERALELDPNLAEAHRAKAVILNNVDLDLAAAEAEYRRALELAPHDAAAMGSLGILSARHGRLGEAVALYQRAIALEPLRTGSLSDLAIYLTALGRYDEAEAALRKAIELQPRSAQNYQRLSQIEILRGHPKRAVELAKQETDPSWRTYTLALAHFANGDRAEADAALKKLIDENADDAGTQIASVYALRKEPEKMFEWLEHAWATHDPGATDVLSDPFLRAYKDDPRMIAFAQKVGVLPAPAAAQ